MSTTSTLDSPKAAAAPTHLAPAVPLWAGRILSALVVGLMFMSAAMKLSGKPAIVEAFVGHFGYPERSLLPIAVAEITCALLYAFPRTSVLGAILVTAYLGGAVATHVRVGEAAFVTPIVVGVTAWAGLFLREQRLRALVPLRRRAR